MRGRAHLPSFVLTEAETLAIRTRRTPAPAAARPGGTSAAAALRTALSQRSVIFLGNRGAVPARIWPTPIIGLEPAVVTESQRQSGRQPCEIDAYRRLRSAERRLAGEC
jgi:hypothetical protein